MSLIKGSKKDLMKNPKFREVYRKLSGRFNRRRNRLRKSIVRKKYWD